MVGSSLLTSLTPFFVSLLLELGSPAITGYWKRNFEKWANDIKATDPVTRNFWDFANHAFTSIQMFSAFVMTTVAGGIVLVVQRDLNHVFFVLLLLTLLYLFFRIFYTFDPHVFATGRVWKYSYDAIFGIFLNSVFISLIISL